MEMTSFHNESVSTFNCDTYSRLSCTTKQSRYGTSTRHGPIPPPLSIVTFPMAFMQSTIISIRTSGQFASTNSFTYIEHVLLSFTFFSSPLNVFFPTTKYRNTGRSMHHALLASSLATTHCCTIENDSLPIRMLRSAGMSATHLAPPHSPSTRSSLTPRKQ